MKKHYRKFVRRAYGNYGDSMKPACGQYTAHITKDCTPIMDEVTCAKCLKALGKCVSVQTTPGLTVAGRKD